MFGSLVWRLRFTVGIGRFRGSYIRFRVGFEAYRLVNKFFVLRELSFF